MTELLMMQIKYLQPKKITAIVVLVLSSLAIVLSGCQSTEAEANTTDPGITVFSTVDEYLAIYSRADGNVRAETNTTSDYYADKNICIIDY